MRRKKIDLNEILDREQAVSKSVAALLRGLTAKRSFCSNGQVVREDDSATQIKSATAILSWAVGPPVQRQQVLVGKLPKTPEELREMLSQKLAVAITNPAASLSGLVQAKKALEGSTKDEAVMPLTESEWVERARQIHGMLPDEPPAVIAPDAAQWPIVGHPETDGERASA
jgi:hypothetical protein